MSTNFYLIPPDAPLDTEEDGDALHIAKFSNGAYALQALQASPFGQVSSWQDWRRILTEAPDWTIASEYGVVWGVEEFVADVEATTPAQRADKIWSVRRGLDRVSGRRFPGPAAAWSTRDGRPVEQWGDSEGFLMISAWFC